MFGCIENNYHMMSGCTESSYDVGLNSECLGV